jgi:hypothetical protein
MKALFLVFLAALMLSACDDTDYQNSTQGKEQAKQTQIQAESNAQVGMPAIVNFAEKRNYKTIYELRDNPNYATYTYFVGMHNEHSPLCHSVGYGIPESSQYTNPSALQDASIGGPYSYEVLPQADPNGLYSSPSANGTWVMCLFKDSKILPVRSEPNVVTLPEPWDQLNQDGM